MPSPFPGMDPYLEEPGLWPDVHHGLISQLQATLNAQLRPRYHVRVEERVYVSDEGDPGRAVIVPDLRVVGPHKGRSAAAVAPETIAAAAVAEPVVVTTLVDDEIHEARLEVLDGVERAAVTVIEILSPSNKVPGSRGRSSYEQKRRDVMNSPSHWVEIDLLRAGVGFLRSPEVPPHHYSVHVSRKGKRPKGTVWPILVTQRLPVIHVPLRGKDPDADVDLQAVLDTAYDRAAYDMEVDYRNDPDPPLEGETAVWADQLLRAKGLR